MKKHMHTTQKSQNPARKLATKRHAAAITIARYCSTKAETVDVAANTSPTHWATLLGDPALNLGVSIVSMEDCS